MKEDGEDVREQQGGEHHPKNNPSRQRRAENAHGQVGSEEDKGEGKCAPSGKNTENLKGELYQIVAGGNNKNMEKHQPEERFLLLCGSKFVHGNLSEVFSDGMKPCETVQ